MAPQIMVANTFYRSKTELGAGEAQRVDKFIQKLITSPSNPGFGFEQIQGAADPNMLSARVNRDLRAILHRESNRFILLYVDHHDAAYAWATRRRVGPHPVTGAIQIVQLPEVRVEPEPAPPPQDECIDNNLDFSRFSAEYLLSLGVPEEWVSAVQNIRTDEAFWPIYEKLPEEPGELLYSLGLGEEVKTPKRTSPDANVATNPDNLRRLHIVTEPNELEELLTKPFDDWMLYLHPSQRYLAIGEFNGPVKVTGAAGTGKTVVAVHRARHLARSGKEVLLTTFNRRLRENIQGRVTRLCTPNEAGSITVQTVHSFAMEMFRKLRPRVELLKSDREWAEYAFFSDSAGFKQPFIFEEWQFAVEQQGVMEWEEYRDTPRVGRGKGLGEAERESLWKVFSPVLSKLDERNTLPWSIICRKVRAAIERGQLKGRFDTVIIDEVQDLSVQEIRLLAALAPQGPDNLILIGDAGQRIYPGGFSLRSMGIEVRGRSRVLNINYRTTREIASAARHLRDEVVDDLDEGGEESTGLQDLLSGNSPVLKGFNRYDEENTFVGDTIAKLIAGGTPPREIGVFARIKRLRWHFEQELQNRGIPIFVPDRSKHDETTNAVYVSTMHGAKGLEFRFVFIVGCQDGQLPASAPISMASDEMERKKALRREKSLLYVAMTRAREQLYISWTGRLSPFLRTQNQSS